MRREGTSLNLPDNPAPYLVEWLMEIGPTVPTGAGEGPIGYRDMLAWSQITGIELEPWEARLLRSLSAAFVGERYRARKPGCPSPMDDDPEVVQARVDQQFANMFKSFAKVAESK